MRGAHRRSTQEKGAGDADARKSTTNGASRAINAVTASSAIAQAGSTGGTLGKTDKSASGGEEIDSSVARRGHSAARRSAVSERPTVGQCQRIVGSWKWPLGHDWVFDHNGSTHSTRGYT